MTTLDPTCIGKVRHVLGATVTVELDAELAGVTPIWRGRVRPVGEIGSLVRIPQGPLTLLASVSMVGIAEVAGGLEPVGAVESGRRWLQVQLLGDIDTTGRFHRGVRHYPALDDGVHLTVADDLHAIFPAPDEHRALLGQLAAAPDTAVALDVGSLVARHSAVVGSTGAGKSSAVASLLQQLVNGGWSSSNVVLIDPHGEYSSALGDVATVRSVREPGPQGLRVPFWMLPASEMLAILAGSSGATTEASFGEKVVDAKRAFVETAAWLNVPPEDVTADAPIPFDLRSVWHDLDFENNAVYEKQRGEGDLQITHQGDPSLLSKTLFAPYGQGGGAPFKGPRHGAHGEVPNRLRASLADPRLRFLTEQVVADADHDPVPILVAEWLGGDRPISILDFSGVPSDVADLAVGIVIRLLFELSVRSTEDDGLGRHRPVLVIVEEAHRFVGEDAKDLVRSALNQVAREGRKYGVGLMMVSQRPSELPTTALSQMGTIIALRLTNGSDQSTVRASLPDEVAGLAAALPSLRTGEALVVGEAVTLPTRVAIRLPMPAPHAEDPKLTAWREAASANDVTDAVARWRGVAPE